MTATGQVTVHELDDNGQPTARGSTPHNPSGDIGAVAVRPDGTAMATANGNGTVILWDLTDLAAPRQAGPPLGGYAGTVNAVTFSPDGRTLAAVSGGVNYKGPGLAPPEADGRGSVILWDVTDFAAPRQLAPPLTGQARAVRSVAISPDGRTLAYGGTDNKVYLWDLTDRTEPRPIGQPLTADSDITSIAFAPDNATLAVGGSNGTLNLWDVADLSRPVTPIASPPTGQSGIMHSVAFSPDSTVLASASYDGTIVLWDLSALAGNRQNALATACAATSGGLDRTQWAAAVHGLDYEDTCTTTN
jgi:WD40 repeat protein